MLIVLMLFGLTAGSFDGVFGWRMFVVGCGMVGEVVAVYDIGVSVPVAYALTLLLLPEH